MILTGLSKIGIDSGDSDSMVMVPKSSLGLSVRVEVILYVLEK